MGNRANEGNAEMTVCLYLPPEADGKGWGNRQVGFMFQRPTIDNNDAFDAAGLDLTIVKPFEELRVDYDGKVAVLDQPEQMVDPKEAFTRTPTPRPSSTSRSPCRADRACSAESPYPTRPRVRSSPKATTNSSSRDRHDRVGDRAWRSRLRTADHSWGPRYWQAPYYYRWLTANVDENFGFMASVVAKRDSDGTRGGFCGRTARCTCATTSRSPRRPVATSTTTTASRGSSDPAAPIVSGGSPASR